MDRVLDHHAREIVSGMFSALCIPFLKNIYNNIRTNSTELKVADLMRPVILESFKTLLTNISFTYKVMRLK